MEKEFVPYELAVKLKELGFEEPCLGIYDGRECKNDGYVNTIYYSNPPYRSAKPSEKNIKYPESYLYKTPVLAPLWQQVFDWFREKYRYSSIIPFNGSEHYYWWITECNPFGLDINSIDTHDFTTYEQARNACLEKLIELVKK